MSLSSSESESSSYSSSYSSSESSSSTNSSNSSFESETAYENFMEIPSYSNPNPNIEVLNIKDFNDKYVEYNAKKNAYTFKGSLNTSWNRICQNGVNKDFAVGSSDEFTYVLLGYDSKSGKKGALRGFLFATIKTDSKGKKYLYIDIVCAGPSTRMKLKGHISVTGRSLIQETFKIANAVNCDYIKLSAIPEVITYYHKVFGFRFIKQCGDTEDVKITAHIKTDLMNVVKSGRKVVPQDISRMIKSHYEHKFMKLDDKAMARPVDRDDIEFETRENVAHTGADGYFMIKCLKKGHVDDVEGMEKLKKYQKGVQPKTRKRKSSKTRTRSRSRSKRCKGGVCNTIRRIITGKKSKGKKSKKLKRRKGKKSKKNGKKKGKK